MDSLPLIPGSLAALALLVLAMARLRRKRLVDDLPTSKTQGVFIGLTELKGTAESEAPLKSYLSEAPCVHYSWQVDEQSTETRVETYTDGKGHTQTRVVRTTKWTTVASGGESAPFYLKDDTGVIRVAPDKAKIEDREVTDVTCGHADPLYFGKGPAAEVPHSDHRRRFRERALPLHAMLYVVGQARERQDVVAPEIAYDKDASLFLISLRTERQVSAGYGWQAGLFSFLGLLAALCGVLAWRILQPAGFSNPWAPYAVAGVAFLAALGLGWTWTAYNSLVNLRQRVRQAWSLVDVQLKMRKDLIPNLAATVEGYSRHEREVQEIAARLRGELAATAPGARGPDHKACASAVAIIAERYPELKASESFLKLQQSLSGTEQRIALARDYFNQIAAFYNMRLLIIPDRFVAALARLRQQPLMAASGFERAEVKVQILGPGSTLRPATG